MHVCVDSCASGARQEIRRSSISAYHITHVRKASNAPDVRTYRFVEVSAAGGKIVVPEFPPVQSMCAPRSMLIVLQPHLSQTDVL